MINRTDNDILFDCQTDILNNTKTIETQDSVALFIADYYVNGGIETVNNFSHDNWLGVACWCEKFRPDMIGDIPAWGRHVIRPDNFALFFWIKHRKIGLVFIWVYFLFQYADLIMMRKDHEGTPHTSGLLLNYFAMTTFNFNLSFSLATKRVNKYFIDGWLGVFKRYYNEDGNIRVLNAYVNKTI